MVVPPCLEQRAGGGRTEWDWEEKRKIRLKNTIETDKEKIKEWKQERKKWQFRSLKAVEKLVLPNPFLLINNKAPKVLDAQVEYIYIYHKKLQMKECTLLTCNRPSGRWEKAKKSELEKWRLDGVRERGQKILLLSALLLSSPFVFFRSPFRATVHYPLSTTLGTG